MKNFSTKIQEQFDRMCSRQRLFRAKISGDDVWDLYIKSFKEDPIFRDPNSSTHNCNLCKNFLRRYGNIVAIGPDFGIQTMFDVDGIDQEFVPVAAALSAAIRGAGIANVFFETFDSLNALPYERTNKNAAVFQLGVDKNFKQYSQEEAHKFGVVKRGEIRTFNHLHIFCPREFVDVGTDSVEAIMGRHRDAKNVFQRAMADIPADTLALVRDLINQGSLLDGQTHLYKVEQILALKKEYDDLRSEARDNWCWTTSYGLPLARFKNELIGVLCTELAEGEDINKACQAWNKRVDPVNYMKTKAPITANQIREAREFIEANGYVESFNRRLATIEDIKVSEIRHINSADAGVKAVSIFDAVKPTSTRHKRNEFDGVEVVDIEKFMTAILPTCTSVEAFLLNRHAGNMVTLTTTKDANSKPIFKWNNNYSWTFNGNLAGKSQIREAVKMQGGNIAGVLRFSIMWAENNDDNSDLDAHCEAPDYHIYYGAKVSPSGGNLDVDIRQPHQEAKILGKDVVENIAWPDIKKMKDGKYGFVVHQFAERGSKGFRAEIEFDGEIFSYSYPNRLAHHQIVKVADVVLKAGKFSITHHLPETNLDREIYGLCSNQFHKVNLICLSPNHWDGNNVGNKHYFFMLDNCRTPLAIRGFHNENLIAELAEHRKVIEVLGATNMIEPADKQLSGLGFNATVRDEVILKLAGTHKRVIKVKF